MNTLKSNWLRGGMAPIKFRAASKGKAMTRGEKISDLNFQKEMKRRAALIQEARLSIAPTRGAQFAGIKILLDNPAAKVKTNGDRSKVYIQPRGEKGKVGKAIVL